MFAKAATPTTHDAETTSPPAASAILGTDASSLYTKLMTREASHRDAVVEAWAETKRLRDASVYLHRGQDHCRSPFEDVGAVLTMSQGGSKKLFKLLRDHKLQPRVRNNELARLISRMTTERPDGHIEKVEETWSYILENVVQTADNTMLCKHLGALLQLKNDEACRVCDLIAGAVTTISQARPIIAATGARKFPKANRPCDYFGGGLG